MTDDDTGLVIEVRVATCRHSELHIRAVETYFWFLYSVLMVALILADPPPSLPGDLRARSPTFSMRLVSTQRGSSQLFKSMCQ